MQLHYEYEAARGVHMLSTLERACGGWTRLRARSPLAIVRSAVHNAVHSIGAEGNVCVQGVATQQRQLRNSENGSAGAAHGAPGSGGLGGEGSVAHAALKEHAAVQHAAATAGPAAGAACPQANQPRHALQQQHEQGLADGQPEDSAQAGTHQARLPVHDAGTPMNSLAENVQYDAAHECSQPIAQAVDSNAAGKRKAAEACALLDTERAAKKRQLDGCASPRSCSAPPSEARLPAGATSVPPAVPVVTLLDPPERAHFVCKRRLSGAAIGQRVAGSALKNTPTAEPHDAATPFELAAQDPAERFAASVTVQHVRTLPPIALLSGTADLTVPWYESVEMERVLREVGCDAQLLLYNGAGHIDWVMDWPANVAPADTGGHATFHEDVVKLLLA